MGSRNRDEFTKKTRLKLAEQAGRECSYPWCRRSTVGATSDGNDVIDIGVAAHICAAAPGGPRYDPEMTPEERGAAGNGIWLCQDHARALDSNDPDFTVENMRRWKREAQLLSRHRVMGHWEAASKIAKTPAEEELKTRLRAAAATDLESFRNFKRWIPTAIARTLDIDELDESVDTAALARGIATLGDLILVAPPGMGKTTTLFQIAEAILEANNGTPIVVPLGNWAADGGPLLKAILRRPAFRAISHDDLRSAAAKPGVILLLDGWNELDGKSRRRAAAEMERLQRELPALGFVVATRDQRRVAPIEATTVRLRPLNTRQQLEIAGVLRPEDGEGIVDRAWRTSGVRDLVTVPLYLTALLALPQDEEFPRTKEEVLRRFVDLHEIDYQRSEALAEATGGFHARYLRELARTATRAANTTMRASAARRSVAGAAGRLEAEGQIATRPQPNTVLDALVNHHLLVREKGPDGFAFQHQQFQEWHASHAVEELMAKSANDRDSRDALRADILNERGWEEPILFACERLARGDEEEQEVCAQSILAALEVDPMLAAEIVWRSSEGVWRRLRQRVEDFVDRWHTPGQVDRAVRFMIVSGRGEFRDRVWPLITHENDQVHLRALRAGGRFRPSVLGEDAARRISHLSSGLRQTILDEIATDGDMEGLEFAANAARADPDPEVKAKVAEGLAFRGAERHIVTVLRDADEATFDLLEDRDYYERIADEEVRRKLAAARDRERARGIPPRQRLASLVREHGREDAGEEVADLIAQLEIDPRIEHQDYIVDLADERFPRAVAEGLLQRVREGREFPIRTTGRLVRAGFGLEDDALLDLALESDRARDGRAEAAASVLGPRAVARLIDRVVELDRQIRDAGKEAEKAAKDLHSAVRDRVCFADPAHVLAAIEERAGEATNQRIEYFADLLIQCGGRSGTTGRRFDACAQARIGRFVNQWGKRLLSSRDATRRQLASVASLAQHSPSKDVLPVLEQLLEAELGLLRGFRERAREETDSRGEAMQEARVGLRFHYRKAFAANCCPESTALMRRFLMDEEFGHGAACVLAEHWRARNEPNDDRLWRGSPDFSRVAERREARDASPESTSDEADAIFEAVDRLTGAEATDAERKRAVALAAIATNLPHGERDGTIAGLLLFADTREKRILLTNLVLAGAVIDLELVRQGIAEALEAAATQYWSPSERHELHVWLYLLPFTTDVSETVAIVQALPEQHHTPRALEGLLEALRHAPGDDAEEVLFALGEGNPRLYAERAWFEAAIGRRTLSCATRLIDLAAQGAFNRKGSLSDYDVCRRLAPLLGEHDRLRAKVYGLLEGERRLAGTKLLARTVAENPDAKGLVVLIDLRHMRGRIPWIAIERVLTERVPGEDQVGTFEVLPVPAGAVRRQLLARTTDGGPDDICARYLDEVDRFRDELGTPESEPRHPDLASGKAWPILAEKKGSSTSR